MNALDSHVHSLKWLRMFSGRTMVALVTLALLMALAFLTLPFSLDWYNVQQVDRAVRHPPAVGPVVSLEDFETGRADAVSQHGRVAFMFYQAVSWFGHDDLGRSLFYRVWPAFLISLSIGLAAAGVAVVIGSLWGATAALAGGRVDSMMMRVVDVLYGLPYILMVILLKIGLTQPLTTLFGGNVKVAQIVILFLAIGGVSWLTMARVVRGQVLSLRAQPFIEAARSMGAGPWHIMRRHLLPNLVGPIVTYATLVIPQVILQESFLSFLGIGVQAPTPSLGRLAADGVEAVNTFVGFWWLIVFPCGVLVVTLLSLNFLGDALRDRFDPKSREATLI
jgi:oligopeptide transport system permease protein